MRTSLFIDWLVVVDSLDLFFYFDNVGNVDVVDVDDVDRKLLLASHVLGQELACGMRRQIKQSINNSSSTHKTTIATSSNDNINRKQYPSKSTANIKSLVGT